MVNKKMYMDHCADMKVKDRHIQLQLCIPLVSVEVSTDFGMGWAVCSRDIFQMAAKNTTIHGTINFRSKPTRLNVRSLLRCTEMLRSNTFLSPQKKTLYSFVIFSSEVH